MKIYQGLTLIKTYTMKERFERFDKYMMLKGLNDNQVTIQCGLSQGLLGQARTGKSDLGPKTINRILKVYQDLNRAWLVAGVEPMLNTPTSPINNSNVITGGTNTNVKMSVNTKQRADVEEAEVIEEFETAPIIPSVWVKRHDFDIMRMTEEQWDNLEHSKVAISGTLIDAWYMMPDNSMAPLYLKGDKVGLALQPTKKIVPGCIYGIDTSTHGMLVRKLFEAENGYRAHAIDEQGFPDFFIAYDETFTLSRVIVLVRL